MPMSIDRRRLLGGSAAIGLVGAFPRRLRAQERSREVGVDDLPPDLRGDLVPGVQLADRGIGDDDVEPPEVGDPLVDGGPQCGVVPDVGGPDDGSRTAET